MQILQGDEWTFEQITLAFLRDFCPAERQAEVTQLLEEKNWEALDALMAPFHNLPA
jgi:hypothetical protein